jgi:hypothetical protein
MTKDEAMKLALEALEESKTYNDTMEFHDRKNKAITVIKEALAQPVQLVTWTGNGSAERRDIEAPTGYFFQVDRRTQPDERNFCSRCGKRTATADLVTIHTCTPPRGNA